MENQNSDWVEDMIVKQLIRCAYVPSQYLSNHGSSSIEVAATLVATATATISITNTLPFVALVAICK